ncbi:MAG TPA: hypothetical protein VMS56_10715 [Thermoanaerobaculia bacterium]|nr:hypothetical protein [Thermoanaerobaculia bacterium]
MSVTDELWDIDRVWDELARRFDRETVSFYRKLAESPGEGVEEAKDEFEAELVRARASGNRDRLRKRLLLAHLILAVFEALRRGETEWRPLPPVAPTWAEEERALLGWSAQHGTADRRYGSA